MGDNVLKLTTELSTKGVEKGFEAIKKGTLSTAKAVNKALDGIKSVVKKVISLAALKKIFDQFKQYLDSSLKKNKEYVASMKALRGSVAAAFQPIYEIAAPAIIYLVKLLNMVVQAIGRFIAALSGKSYSQMLKNAQALSKQKDLLNGVGGAAKDAARQLMSFDEINRLEDNSGSGSDMTFSEVDLGSATGAIDDFAKKLRELFQNGQFEQAGELIANSVNKMLDAFDAEKLGAKVGTWVQNFADFMNGLLFGIEWDKIGEDLAKGINGLLSKVKGSTIGEILRLKFTVAIGMFAGFIKNFDGSQAGSFLGDALLGFAQGLGADIEKNFDAEFWEKLNQNIEDGFAAFVPRFISALKVAVDTVIKQAPEVIGTLGNIGLQVVDAITEALSSMDEEIQLFDDRGFQLNATQTRWEALGASVAEGFNGIDWAGILSGSIDAIGKLTNGLVEFLSSAVAGIGDKWTEIGVGIADGVNSIKWSEILEKGLITLEDLASGLLEVLKQAIDGIEWDEIGKGIVDGITSVDWLGLVKQVGDVIESILIAIVEFILGIFDGIFKTSLAKDFKDWVGEERELAKDAEVAARVIEHTTDDGYNLLEAPSRWREMGLTENDVLTFAGDYFESSSRQLKEFIEETGLAQEALEKLGLTAEDVANTDQKDLMPTPPTLQNPDTNGMQDASDQIDRFLNQLLEGASKLEAASGYSYLLKSGISNEDIVLEAQKILDSTDARYAQVARTLEELGIELGAVQSDAQERVSEVLDNLTEYGNYLINNPDKWGNLGFTEEDVRAFASQYFKTDEARARFLKDAGIDAFTESINSVSDSAGETAATVDESAGAIDSSVTAACDSAAAAIDSVSTSTNTLVSVAAALASAINGIQFGKIGTAMRSGASIGVDFSNLLHAADGAVIPPNREFMAVFGDQRTGTNIEAPESLIRQIVREEAGSSGNSGRLESLLEELIGTVGNIRIGDDTIGRAATRYSRAHGRAVGV